MHDQTYSIRQLAQEFDVAARAIRFYEIEGLLHPSRSGSRRMFSRRDRVRLMRVLRGKPLGSTLADTRERCALLQSGCTQAG